MKWLFQGLPDLPAEDSFQNMPKSVRDHPFCWEGKRNEDVGWEYVGASSLITQGGLQIEAFPPIASIRVRLGMPISNECEISSLIPKLHQVHQVLTSDAGLVGTGVGKRQYCVAMDDKALATETDFHWQHGNSA